MYNDSEFYHSNCYLKYTKIYKISMCISKLETWQSLNIFHYSSLIGLR